MKWFLDILFVFALAGMIFLIGAHYGRSDLRDTAREEFCKYKSGQYLMVHSLGVGIDAFGEVHVYPRGAK